MGPELRMAASVGGIGPGGGGIVQDGPKPVVFGPGDVGMAVDDHAGDGLALAGGLHPGLGLVQLEAFVGGDDPDEVDESGGVADEASVAGDDEVVGVARCSWRRGGRRGR
jgi:hypothetical protein